MCGICGFFKYGRTSFELNAVILKKMNDKLIHRGPDDDGYYLSSSGDTTVGLGMRRLAVIDLKTGKQPITNEDGSVIVILNGEIYNYLELRQELEKKGHRFKTTSDTETIAHLYEDYGPAAVTRLRGMFAFAVFDSRNRKLVIARDRLGKKPLFYTFGNGYLAFASELKSLLELPDVKKEIDPDAIDEYLTYGYISSPGSIFHNIFKLKPAAMLIFDGTKTDIKSYWSLSFREKTKLSYGESKIELEKILEEAVRIRLYSDVPLGAFLSGGIDSSIVVAIMSKLLSRPVKTFSIGFEEQDFSELKYARKVAQLFKTDHTEIIVKPDAIEDLPKLAYHYGEPYSDSSALPSYYVCREARKYVTVALNGDGGDESFAGYLRYKANEISRWIYPFSRMLFLHKLSGYIPSGQKSRSILRWSKRFLDAMSHTKEERNLLWHIIFSNRLKSDLYTGEMKKEITGDKCGLLLGDVAGAPASNDLERFLYSDIVRYLPEDLLVKMDIASMMNSLETRSPFLDHKLMEFAASLPKEYKMRCFSSKYILKDMFSKVLPKEILHRTKMGFGIPITHWFRGRLKNYIGEVLLDSKTVGRGYFRKEAVKKLLEEHWSGNYDHSYRLWNLLFLEIWHREYLK